MRDFMGRHKVGVHTTWMELEAVGPDAPNNGLSRGNPNAGVARWPTANPQVHPHIAELEALIYADEKQGLFGSTLIRFATDEQQDAFGILI